MSKIKESTPSSFSFGLKLKFKEKEGVQKDVIYLKNIEDGHKKYYEIKFLNQGNSINTFFTVIITYGKIGVVGGTKRHGFATEQQARDFMQRKMREKLKKGYKLSTNKN